MNLLPSCIQPLGLLAMAELGLQRIQRYYFVFAYGILSTVGVYCADGFITVISKLHAIPCTPIAQTGAAGGEWCNYIGLCVCLEILSLPGHLKG